ncbi:MAG: DUF465 domain-containing protein [Gammaproteobacteria bacterium]|nr:DUF465 domain-containing protein [Gammaproteobacteria bacterium]
MADDEIQVIKKRIIELKLEHRDLDDVIRHLIEQPTADQLQITRLKKRKLLLKDTIHKLQSSLIPDMPA